MDQFMLNYKLFWAALSWIQTADVQVCLWLRKESA